MLKVENLSFTYPGNKRPTLENLTFQVRSGEIFGFLGPSGAGKSTTQKIIIGLLKNYQGSVQVFGNELRTHGSDYYEKIGVAFELPNLYLKMTALENLNFFRSLYSGPTEEPLDLLTMVDLAESANARVSQFSKGMMMRLNFCRAFLNQPQVVFLDEPTAGLDPVNSRRIKEIILQKKKAGVTVLLTTHNMTVAEDLCDRVAFIVDGKINLIDSPWNLKVQNGKRIVKIEYRENGVLKTADFPLAAIGSEPEFLNLLTKRQIETIHTQEATLEEVFIKVTGRSLV